MDKKKIVLAEDNSTLSLLLKFRLEKEVGSISIGKQANLILTKPINSYGFIPYSFGTHHIDEVFLKGKLIEN